MNTNTPVIYQTNGNNAWTLTKHLAHSINAAAGKVDKQVYGQVVVPVKQSKPAHEFTFMDGVCGFFGLIIILGFIVAVSSSSDKSNGGPKWWWFGP